MKKILTIILFLVVVSTLFFLVYNKGEEDPKNVISNALLGDGSASCLFVDPHSKLEDEIIFHFKEGKIKMGAVAHGVSLFLVIKDDTVYAWNSMLDYVVYYPIEEIGETGSPFSFDDKEKLIEEIGNNVVWCLSESLDDDVFALPEGKQFYHPSEIE